MPLVRVQRDEITCWSDPDLLERGILIAFTERSGGASAAPYESLNLAAHAGDEPPAVDDNRSRLLDALGIGDLTERLVTAEQVHGTHVALVAEADAGRGAKAVEGAPPIPATDALVTASADLPIMLLFADCVPIVLLAAHTRAVAVAHAGWRGALAGIPGKTVRELCSATGADPSEVVAYIGPHVCAKCYQVGDDVMSQFIHTFVTVSRAAAPRLDLGAAVSESLMGAGVSTRNIVRLDVCTAETTQAFFSYRAEAGVTGRHAALACVLGTERAGR